MEQDRWLRTARACLLTVAICLGVVVLLGLGLIVADEPYSEDDHLSRAMAGGVQQTLLYVVTPIGVLCLIAAAAISVHLTRHERVHGRDR